MTAPARLVATSLLAQNADPLFTELARFLSDSLADDDLSMDVALAPGAWSERRRRLVEGRAHLAGLCGALYLADRELADSLELLVAPVFSGEGGVTAPVYYTDVIVAQNHPARRFADLRGCVWAYNEPASHSGYHVVRANLAALGQRSGFFGRAVEAGSHQAALALVLRGAADAAPIDSYVLARERANRPELSRALRVIERLGPSPAPPLAIASSLPSPLRRRVGALLAQMHESAEGRRLLARHMLARFCPVVLADYEPLRTMAAAGEGVAIAPFTVDAISGDVI